MLNHTCEINWFKKNNVLIINFFLGKSDSDDSSGTSKRMADHIDYNKPIKVSNCFN